jgi:hypothetical protein
VKSHRMDGVSLIFALLFIGAVASWVVSTVAHVRFPEPGWIIAGGLIFFGVVGLIGTWRSGRSRGDNRAHHPTDMP